MRISKKLKKNIFFDMIHYKRILLSCLSVLLTLTTFSQEKADTMHKYINHRGQDLFLSGINVAWMSYGNDLVGFKSDTWEQICEDVVSAGGNSLRWWIHVDGRETPTYDEDNDTVIGIDSRALENLALAMDIAATKGIVVSLCLWAHGMLCIDDGDKGSYQAITRVRRNKMLLEDSIATQRYIDNALIPMVNAVKNHTAVLCWEIFNEPEALAIGQGEWGNYEHVEMSCIQRFVNQCAGAIHRTDPNAKVSNGTWHLATLTTYDHCTNYYSDEALYNAGHDKDGYLDFYMFHYYPSEIGSDRSPFHQTRWDLKLSKNTIIGEFPAYGIVKKKGTTFIPRVQLKTKEALLWLWNQGYSGGWGWTYTNHDGNGGLDDMREALGFLRDSIPEHIIVKHDPTFNYIPRITKRIPDTVLFKNSPKVENFINVNDYFEDDDFDKLSFSITTTGEISANLSDEGLISFTANADKIGYATITVTATDLGGKYVSQTFSIMIREENNTSDNKLLNAFVTYSSNEDVIYPQYYANDGNLSTRWSSEYNDNEFICFDMLKEEEIRRIVLWWEWNEEEKKGAYADAYSIEISNDGQNWDTVFFVKQGQSIKSNIVLRKDNEDPIVCRYVKLNFSKRATSWGYSLREVEAFNFDDHANNGEKIKTNTRDTYQPTYANQTFSFQIMRSFFVDTNDDVLSITTNNCPSWLNFDPYTFYLTGTPSQQDTGTYNVTFVAEDFFGVNKSLDIKIKVWPDPNAAIEVIENPVTIYPNPCSIDSFTITIPNVEGKTLASFTNTEGKLVAIKYALFTNGQATFLTDGLAKGVYTISIRVNGETYKSKVVIE